PPRKGDSSGISSQNNPKIIRCSSSSKF
ncbi:hypothetical protein CCACVL1_00215, partial [Corchorus capsularis]